MTPEHHIHQAQCGIRPAETALAEIAQLDDVAARLMAVQRGWDADDRQVRLAAALDASRRVWHGIQSTLAEGALPLPAEVQHNLLILSVYADSKIAVCEDTAEADALGSLIALTRTLAGSLREWREAA